MSRVFSPMVRVLLGCVLLVLYLVPLGQAGTGIIDRQVTRAGHPMTLLMPDSRWQLERHADEHTDEESDALLTHPGDPMPAIILVHGFAGSRQMVSAYGYTLAHAGYVVLMLDLPGHGRNRAPFAREANVAAIGEAFEVLQGQPEVDISRIGLLGHSMGAEAVLHAALESPERYRATVAVSPVYTAVSPVTPRNLQLQAGSWESRYLEAAGRILVDAGGANTDFANGRARALVTVLRAEHIGILFRNRSHQAARQWFDQAFEYQSAGSNIHHDWRFLGWLLHVAGWLLVASAIVPAYRREASRERDLIRRPLQWAGVLAAPFVATGVVLALDRFVSVSHLGGVVVGGALAFWFLVAGTVFLLVAYRRGLPRGADIARGVGLFLFLAVAVGITGHLAWANWALTPARLVRWPLFALACTPWFVATEFGQGDPCGTSRWLWWGAQVASVLAALLLLARFVPGMGVVALILPLLPAYFALFVYLGGKVRRPWAYGIGCGLFFGWLLAVAFPIVG